MHYVPAIIIGAGQAGLAMIHCLGRRRIDHIVLERGQIGERWRSERWDTLRLLTPNWMSRLPGWSYHGDDPDGFMTAPEFVGYLEAYAATSRAPVQAGASVISVRPSSHGYRVETSRGVWEARVVVIATGHCDVPRAPALAQRLPRWIHQISPSEYRNPAQLRDGAVLVVGASATGVQLAAEIRHCRPDCRHFSGEPHPTTAELPWARHLVVARQDRLARRNDGRGFRPAAGPRPTFLSARRRAGRAHAGPWHIARYGRAHRRTHHQRGGDHAVSPR